ncbi:M4 family metallopeptidase [Streptomyces sp. SID10815]|nr:M4 family metallopeptidase [Streptomyces sp. SID10815]
MRGAPIRTSVAVVMAATTLWGASALSSASAAPGRPAQTAGTLASRHASAAVVAAAEAAAHAHAAATGVSEDDVLKATDALEDAGGRKHVRFQRTHDGLAVLGADLIIHLDARNQYLGVTRATDRAISVSTTTPKKSAADARTTAADAAGGTAGQAELVVSALADKAPVLAYRIRVTGKATSNDTGVRDVVVDAATGKVLSNAPVADAFLAPSTLAKLNKAAQKPASPPPATGAPLAGGGKPQPAAAAAGTDISGNSLYSGTVTLTASPYTDGQGTKWNILRDPSRANTEVRDANGQQAKKFSDGQLIGTTGTTIGNGSTSNRTTVAVDAMYGITKTLDFYKNTFGRDGIGGNGGGAYGMVHWGSKVGNAFWSPDCGCMEYGDGDGSTFKNPLVVLDVTGHELTHGVVDATANLQPTRIDSRGNQFGEPGALNESLADIFGTGMEFATNNSKNPPNYLLGEKLGLAQGFLRRLDQPSLDKLEGTVDYWSSKAYDTEVHAGSGISSHAFYLLAEGSGKKTIGDVAYNSATYDGAAVTGIGRAKALNIFYTALTSYMVSTTDFHGARTATLNAAKDLYGAGSTEYQTVNRAWAAVNVTAANG